MKNLDTYVAFMVTAAYCGCRLESLRHCATASLRLAAEEGRPEAQCKREDCHLKLREMRRPIQGFGC